MDVAVVVLKAHPNEDQKVLDAHPIEEGKIQRNPTMITKFKCTLISKVDIFHLQYLFPFLLAEGGEKKIANIPPEAVVAHPEERYYGY